VIPHLAILTQYWCVTDTQTDTQTHDDGIYRTNIAACGKKCSSKNMTNCDCVCNSEMLFTANLLASTKEFQLNDLIQTICQKHSNHT